MPRAGDWWAAGESPVRDVVAGLSVAVVSLPVTLACGQSSGMGARAGLATAVVAGAVAAVFCGCGLQIAGPVVVTNDVVVPVFHQYGPRGVWTVEAMAALLLLGGAVTGLARYLRFLPMPVVEGLTVGGALAIILRQAAPALGVGPPHGERSWQIAADAMDRFALEPHLAPLLLALGVAALVLAGARYVPAAPTALIGIAAATAASVLLDLPGAHAPLGPVAIPVPSDDIWEPKLIVALLPQAGMIAALVALEGLLCSAVLDNIGAGEAGSPDRDLFGHGIANLLVPVFGGIPATATMARSAISVRCGARSRLAALVCAATVGVLGSTLFPLIGSVPAAALAGVTLAAATSMIRPGALGRIARCGRMEAAMLATTAAMTVATSVATAMAAGMIVAIVAAFVATVAGSHLRHEILSSVRRSDSNADEAADEPAWSVLTLEGAVSFATAARLSDQLETIDAAGLVILHLAHVTALDATGAHLLSQTLTRLERRGTTVLLAGLHPRHHGPMAALGLLDHLGRQRRVFPTLTEAVAHAETPA